MLTIRAMSDGSGYSVRHLQHSDYYAEGERITGHWQGRGAELLGLAGEVRSEQFDAVRQGLDPQSGEFLRPRQSADRISADGTIQSRGRNLYDFTFSAPKSVSIMVELGHDARLVEAHRTAVQEALRELECCAATRVRMDGTNDNRTTGNLVLAVYHHDTSRELDPQLHTHAVAANLTYDGVEGRWKALQATGIYERRSYLTEVYRNALAGEVRSLGYKIEDRRGPKGKDLGLEIKGMSDELLGKYSQRSEQRDEAIAEFIKVNNRQPTDNEIAILVRESRADKLIEISTAEVHQRQQARLAPEERLCLEQAHENALGGIGAQQLERTNAAASLDYAERHVFESPLTARSKIREVIRGLVATRQVHTLNMGHAPHYYVAGTLPEFAPAPTIYASSSISAAGYFMRFNDHEDRIPEPSVPEPAVSKPAPSASFVAEAYASGAANGGGSNGHKADDTGKSAPARNHFSRPAAHARHRKPATSSSNGRSARRPIDSRSAGARPTNGTRSSSNGRWSSGAAKPATGKGGPFLQRPFGATGRDRQNRRLQPGVSAMGTGPPLPASRAQAGPAACRAPRRRGRIRAPTHGRARSNRTPALTASAKAGNSKRYGFTSRTKQGTKKRG